MCAVGSLKRKEFLKKLRKNIYQLKGLLTGVFITKFNTGFNALQTCVAIRNPFNSLLKEDKSGMLILSFEWKKKCS